MKKNILIILGIIAIALLNAFAFAHKQQDEKLVFNTATANQKFDQIHKKLASHQDYAHLVRYIRDIGYLNDQAKECSENSESHLKNITELLKSTQTDTSNQLQRADLKYLRSKQTYYTQQLSECRLLVYRSHETLANYRDVIQKLGANEILQRGAPIWKLHDNHWMQAFDGIEYEKILKASGITLITPNHFISGLILLLVTGAIATYLCIALRRGLASIDRSHTLWQSFLHVLSLFVLPCALLGAISVFLNALYQDVSPIPTLLLLSHAVLLFVLSIAIAKFLFYPSQTLLGLFALPPDYGCIFFRRVFFLLLLLFIGYVFTVILQGQAFSDVEIALVRTLFLTMICVTTAWIFILWYRSIYANRFHHGTSVFFATLFIGALCVLMLMEWFGYHRLTMFAVTGLCLTVLFTVGAVALWRLIDSLYHWVDDTKYEAARKIRRVFGVKLHHKMHELTLVRIAAHFTVLCFYFIMILKSWNISPIFIDSISDGLLSGFKFIGLTIVPSRWVLAAIAFAIVFSAGRLISANVAKKQRFKGEEDTQIAVATITIYIFFSIAFLFALLVTGVDFTGLAIIAGALSVGVGLGLQHIVNNFVSGLILLIEKPIKPGDRIVIGKTEGFVRKIRIRSTQISTLAKEDVIVPNADFITQQVTNYMFRDRHARVSCQVGVEYGSDVHLVKKILLEIASRHPEVLQDYPNAPVALFSRFADSSLVFDLWCVIHDVNKKSLVVSELNFAIDAAFREHQIMIAFPQMDVRIKRESDSDCGSDGVGARKPS